MGSKTSYFQQSPLELITSRIQSLLDEKKKIETEKSWKKEDLNQLKSLFDINCNFYKHLTGKQYPQNWG
jgi:hypothetical protein